MKKSMCKQNLAGSNLVLALAINVRYAKFQIVTVIQLYVHSFFFFHPTMSLSNFSVLREELKILSDLMYDVLSHIYVVWLKVKNKNFSYLGANYKLKYST